MMRDGQQLISLKTSVLPNKKKTINTESTLKVLQTDSAYELIELIEFLSRYLLE